jgi:hypothetical protein
VALDAKFGDGKYLLESNEGLPQWKMRIALHQLRGHCTFEIFNSEKVKRKSI